MVQSLQLIQEWSEWHLNEMSGEGPKNPGSFAVSQCAAKCFIAILAVNQSLKRTTMPEEMKIIVEIDLSNLIGHLTQVHWEVEFQNLLDFISFQNNVS